MQVLCNGKDFFFFFGTQLLIRLFKKSDFFTYSLASQEAARLI